MEGSIRGLLVPEEEHVLLADLAHGHLANGLRIDVSLKRGLKTRAPSIAPMRTLTMIGTVSYL
ncbi:hypothetical protein [Specibacter sp. NPDC078692]|uniref:hypothetical protein n=1 Tax=Specibacter sp. NPDC078692 TaxID=3155818 RepID=UPI003414754A